ncbi:SGNH/GDSL hydrolase family protein [Roseibium aggregatum]|uniref:SGNH hydrolase-type esterase domain-containing protein n=1 Tax=Roseibium aggregatum TaxID=187304 RepID=A0A939J383_9HYPH|nr:GDSL-type esterase/lipase family protein [Roseibium aggregatum]MBN9669870.1 hypothetical protein [Roseibium aggregatum]
MFLAFFTVICATATMSALYLKAHGVFSAIAMSASPGDQPVATTLPNRNAGPRVVHFLGASLFSRGTWLAALETALNQCGDPEHNASSGALPKNQISVTATPGENSTWGVEQLAEIFAPDRKAPDILIVGFSANDAALHRGITLNQSRRNLDEIIAQAQKSKTHVMLATLAPAFGPRKWVRPGLSAYKALYHDLADQYDGVDVIDTLPVWRTLSANQLRDAIPDGLHPTDETMRRLLLPILKEAISGKQKC